MAAAEGLGTPDELTDDERAAVEAVLRPLADDEFVLAERYTEWQVVAPTLESDLSMANIAQDEYGHARLWYDLLEDFGYDEADLLWERDPETFRHASLADRPFDEGEWADVIVRGYLYDAYEDLVLDALADSAYPRIADRVEKVQAEERYHTEHARNWLERLCDDDPGREQTQRALDRMLPHALALFQPSEHEARIVELGVRTRSLDDLETAWLDRVVPYLESLGLELPGADGGVAVDLPDQPGRWAGHDDAWFELYDDFTHTYRDYGYEEPPTLMKDPDDV